MSEMIANMGTGEWVAVGAVAVFVIFIVSRFVKSNRKPKGSGGGGGGGGTGRETHRK